MVGSALAHIDSPRIPGHQREHAVSYKCIVNHHVGSLEDFISLACQQTRVTGASADEPNSSCFFAHSVSPFYRFMQLGVKGRSLQFPFSGYQLSYMPKR